MTNQIEQLAQEMVNKGWDDERLSEVIAARYPETSENDQIALFSQVAEKAQTNRVFMLESVVTVSEVATEYGIDENTIRKVCQNEMIPVRKSGSTFLMLRPDIEKYFLSPSCEVYEHQNAWAVSTPAHKLSGLTKTQAWLIAFQYGRSSMRYQAAINAVGVPETPDVDMGSLTLDSSGHLARLTNRDGDYNRLAIDEILNVTETEYLSMKKYHERVYPNEKLPASVEWFKEHARKGKVASAVND